jgi:hypothetical protein
MGAHALHAGTFPVTVSVDVKEVTLLIPVLLAAGLPHMNKIKSSKKQLPPGTTRRATQSIGSPF